jgi:hypothetical protein
MEKYVWTEVLPPVLQILCTHFTSFLIPGCHRIICGPQLSMWPRPTCRAYAVLSKQHKATEPLSSYLITSCWNRKSETVEGSLLTIVVHSEEIHIEMLGQEVML